MAAALLLFFWLAMLASLRDKSLTYDEAQYAVAGCSYWRLDDYRLSPEAGLLPQRIVGLPLALGPYAFPSADSPDWRHSQLSTLAYDWFYRMGNDAERMAESGRAASGLLAVLLGAVVWAWSRRLFGPRGGMISLALYILNPVILANGALMTSDAASALFFLAALWAWWAMLHRLSAGRLLASALLAGGLFVSKMSAVLILPVLLVLTVARILEGSPLPASCGRWRGEIRSRVRQALAFALAGAAHAAVVVAVIWACSGFRYAAMAHPGPDERLLHAWDYALDPSHPSQSAAAVGFLRRHELLPEGWLFGFAAVLRRAESRPAFWNGACSQTGWAGFFPYAFLVKTPLSVFGVCGLALGAGWAARRRVKAWYATLPLWLFAAVYAAAAISSHLNIGLRHMLPAYGPLFILCGASARWVDEPRRRLGALLCLLLALLAAETAWRFPNYLAYFNGLVRPSEGYRHLVDSSLDWGQELPATAGYIDEHPADGPFYLSYFGMASPGYFGVQARLLYSFGIPYTRERTDLRVLRLPAGDLAEGMAALQRQQADCDPMGIVQIGGDNYAVFLKKAGVLRLAAGTYLISATMLQPVYYPGPWGPWNRRYEATYRRLLKTVEPLLETDPVARAAAFARYDLDGLIPLLDQFEQYRLARLTFYLRERHPDAEINGSILVYRLTDAELAGALD